MNSEEKEIDEIFTNMEELVTDDFKIKHLEECKDKIPLVFPYMDLIHEEINNLIKNFSVYRIQLDAISKDLNTIRDKNTSLKNQNQNQSLLYEHLKDLCISMSMGEDDFYVLENGSFEDNNILSKMEKSINILTRKNLDKYKINVVEDKLNEINLKLRNFLKRFVNYFGKKLFKSETTEGLCVHRNLYHIMDKYEFIYTFSKEHPDYYSILCSIYLSHARKMYEFEMDEHLDNMEGLLNNSEKLHTFFKVLTESYESLIKCETDFIKKINIEVAVDEIFTTISTKIVDFIGKMYTKSKIGTLVSIGIILNNKKELTETYNHFIILLEKRYDILIKIYFEIMKEEDLSYYRVERLNFILQNNCLDKFKNQYLELFINKMKINKKLDGSESALQKLQILYSIDLISDNLTNMIEDVREECTKLIIKDVFSKENEVKRVKELFENIKNSENDLGKTSKFLYEILIEHGSKENKIKYDEFYEQNKQSRKEFSEKEKL